ncbi:MAG: TrkA family potassium uptake protein [Actinobacteria bacterium]|nr:TrkA family potassium uptake protein [Actinomycetota bacterium]MCB9412727.1 TrkA family potassium uptake protein [Actinomycetota bacterium]
MHVVIMGCGRVGAKLATDLDLEGHSVAVIDQDDAAFGRLPDSFAGITVKGVGFDRDAMIRAGVERAVAFAAVSSGDNSNIIAARVARETFGVENVVARIYDPRRAEVYQRLGIPTVATVAWTAAETLHQMLPERVREEWRDPSGTIALGEFAVDAGWIGTLYSTLARTADVTLAVVNRFGQGLLPHPDLVVQQDDRVHLMYEVARAEDVESILASAPVEEK